MGFKSSKTNSGYLYLQLGDRERSRETDTQLEREEKQSDKTESIVCELLEYGTRGWTDSNKVLYTHPIIVPPSTASTGQQ